LKIGNYKTPGISTGLSLDDAFDVKSVGSVKVLISGSFYKIDLTPYLFSLSEMSERSDNDIINIIDRIPAITVTIIRSESEMQRVLAKIKLEFEVWINKEQNKIRNAQYDSKASDKRIFGSFISTPELKVDYESRKNYIDNMEIDLNELTSIRWTLKARLESLRSLLTHRREVKGTRLDSGY
jgi:hypothetical protein